MSFSDAVIFLAAIIVVVGAGVVLGMSLRGANSGASSLGEDTFEIYLDTLLAVDELRGASDEQKRDFIHAYYAALLVAPDSVLVHLNRYLKLVTADEYDEAATQDARDEVAIAMRRAAQGALGNKTKATTGDMISIEIGKPGQSAAPVGPTAEPAPLATADPYQPTDYA